MKKLPLISTILLGSFGLLLIIQYFCFRISLSGTYEAFLTIRSFYLWGFGLGFMAASCIVFFVKWKYAKIVRWVTICYLAIPMAKVYSVTNLMLEQLQTIPNYFSMLLEYPVSFFTFIFDILYIAMWVLEIIPIVYWIFKKFHKEPVDRIAQLERELAELKSHQDE